MQNHHHAELHRPTPTATLLALILMTCSMLAACGSSAAAPAGTASTASTASTVTTFVGAVDDSALRIAALRQGDDLLVYLCDGATGSRVTGRLANGSFTADIAGAGPLQMAVTGDRLTGSLQVGTARHPVTAEVASGSAALLWAKGTDTQGQAIAAGWIVGADGKETGGVVIDITDGTSNTLQLAGALANDRQRGIIAILIGLRKPLDSAR